MSERDKNSRLFTDLIRDASDWFGNWTPNQTIEVGDYGTVNRETGVFEKEGSIYDQEFSPVLHEDIMRNHGIHLCQPEDQVIVVSRGCKSQAFTTDFSHAHPEIVGSNIKGRWSFSRGRGAIVVLHRPTEKIIQGKERLFPRPEFTEALEGKALVTGVYTCPRYAQLLTDSAAWRANAAIGLRFMDVAGASMSGTWHHYSTSGVWRSGGQEGGLTFHPLYTLKTPKPKGWLERMLNRRGDLEQEPSEDTFITYQPPWDVLDDDGNETTPESPLKDEDETLDF